MTINYEIYIQSSEWQEKAELAKAKVFYRCQICNRHQDQIQLDAHHRTYERLGQEISDDITVLCRDCHALYSKFERLVKSGYANLPQSHSSKTFSELINEYNNKIQNQTWESIPTGFIHIDLLTAGLNKSCLTLIAGESGIGKTSLSISILVRILEKFDTGIAFFSLQHPAEQIIRRILSQITKINSWNIQFGEYSKDENEIIKAASNWLASLNVTIDDTLSITSQNLRDKCFALYAERKIDLIVIDGIELITSPNHSKKQETSEVAREIKAIARELNVPILATTSQIESSDKWSNNKNLTLANLSFGLEQSADVIMLMSLDNTFVQNKNEPRERELVNIDVAKNCTGRNGIVQEIFIKSIAKFDEPIIRSAPENVS